jgi:DNA-binding GntR family transcriptional regulator
MIRVSILWQTTGIPTHNEQVMLDLEAGEHIIRAARLRLDDDEVLAYELVSVPVDLLPTTNGTSALQDIQQLSAANRLKLGQATERASQVAADRILAKYLGVARGDTIDMFDRIMLLDTGRPIEWRIAFARP